MTNYTNSSVALNSPLNIQKVLKSSGILQEFDPPKFIKVLEWACEKTMVDPYDLYRKVKPHLVNEMTTTEIQAAAIKVAADNITANTPDYQFVASNLAMFALRKTVYGQFEPIPLYDLIVENVSKNVYDSEVLRKYTKDEIETIETIIDHNNDFKMAYAGTQQLIEKYLVKNRSTGKIYESPQYAYILIAMTLHQDEDSTKRMEYIENFYNNLASKKISLPTPIMAGVRTPTRQFSSCVVIESGDSLNSINESASAVVKYISKRAGIGLHGGAIRAEGSSIGPGEVRHTGVLPFWKHFQTAVKSCSQGGIRSGSATVYYPAWHLEFENLIVLKNNKGVDENRIRHMDYAVQLNNLMINRIINDGYITLFSPDVADGKLFEYFYSDEEKFKELYESLESDSSIRKKRIKASEFFATILNERANTGRIYIMFVDNANNHTPFRKELDPIRLSNLCLEICLPTKPLDVHDKGEIALCTLAAYVLGNFDSSNQEEINGIAMTMVRALDNLLSYQDYPVEQAKATLDRRALGIGVTNYASWLAQNYMMYTSNEFTLKAVHELFERLQYGLIKASVQLAKEKGSTYLTSRTKYAQGLTPIDWYNKHVDELGKFDLVCDWDSLKEDLNKYGIRNSTLSAFMPSETSSQISNSTNGIEPPRAPVITKQSKDGVFNQVVPMISELDSVYDYAWSMAKRGNEGYIKHVAIMQKFVDQSISSNLYYDPAVYPNNKVPLSVMMEDIMMANYYGVKTLYYHNTRDGAEGSAELDCDACKI